MLRLRQEDWERNKKIADEENKWRSERDKVKNSQIKMDHALRVFPKISNRELLPTHFKNFSDILHSCGVPEKKRTCRLGEILTGQLSVALQNLKLTADTPFEEAKSQLLRAVGFTQVAAARSCLRPDTDTLKNMGPIDLVNTLESLVTRLLSGASTVDEANLRLTTAYLKNVGNSHCITLLESKRIESRADLRDAIITYYDNHVSVVNEDHNVAKFFSGLSKKREREMPYNCSKTFGYSKPTCFKCGQIGHKALNVIIQDQGATVN